MGYLPVFLDLTRRPVLVVGGGLVAQRKVLALLNAEADVTLISPSVTDALLQLAADRRIRHLRRECVIGDVDGQALVFACTGDRALDERLAERARALGIPINVADEPELCTFIAPSVIRRGDLQIAISTSGASPAMARRLRERLEREFGEEHAAALELMRAARVWLKERERDGAVRARVLERLACSNLILTISCGDIEAANEIVIDTVGVDIESICPGFAARLLRSQTAQIPG